MTLTRKSLAVAAMFGLVLGGCDRFGAKPDQSTAASESAEVAAVDDGAADMEPSGPLPPRQIDLVATEFEPGMIGNVYVSDFQDMIIDRWDAEGAAGRYALGQGYFDGALEAGSEGPDGIDRLEGYWRQAAGDTRCAAPRDGTHYWGRFQFNFVRDRQRFIGFWGHCEGTPLDRWNGQFSHRDAETARAVNELLAAR
ncbi:MAG: hypothetical protein ACRED4_07355 [Brevundimonas sp.]